MYIDNSMLRPGTIIEMNSGHTYVYMGRGEFPKLIHALALSNKVRNSGGTVWETRLPFKIEDNGVDIQDAANVHSNWPNNGVEGNIWWDNHFAFTKALHILQPKYANASECKYISCTVDMRDDRFVVRNRNNEIISPMHVFNSLF